MVRPRRFSSGRRSASTPVNARTSAVLPWSIWPAVARIMPFLPSFPRKRESGGGHLRRFPPGQARGRLWAPAFTGVTVFQGGVQYVELPDEPRLVFKAAQVEDQPAA